MRHSSGRSSSLLRCPRPNSAKRGQRASTPSRRLSDLQERPAWDATSSDLDKFKLTAEEQERRKAARISKNRPLASDVKRSFIEAWAKDVTADPLEQEDTVNDQDAPSSSHAPARELPINYSSVVNMLRKSPGAARGAASTADNAALGGALTPGSRGVGSTSEASDEVQAAEAGDTDRSASRAEYLGEGAAAAAGPCDQQRQQAGGSGEVVAALGGAAGVRRAEISVTPAALRPRFNPADATTIIAYGDGSDSDGQEEADADHGDAEQQQHSSPGCDDHMTSAFEAALFGRGAHGSTAAPAAGGPALAWATSRGVASPINAGAGDVERRLRALEAAMAGNGGGGGGSLLQEDVVELRMELHKVQQDNAKLRQELGAFSTHASTLLTQLQAQVNQLLRSSSSGGASAASSSGLPQPQPQLQPPPHPTRHPQQQQQLASVASVPAVATIPTTVLEASRSVGYGFASAYESQPQPQPLHIPVAQQAQPVVRRNIFADLDESVLRPLSAAARAGSGGGEAGGPAGTPQAMYGVGNGRPATASVVTAASPYSAVTAAPAMQYTQQAIPVNNIDDADIALPSFSTFRRSAGASAFTATRAPGLSNQALHVSPSAAPNTYTNTAAPLGSDGPGPSPSSAAAIQPRSFPTQYQPRSIGGVLVRPGPGGGSSGANITVGPAAAAAAAAAATNASGAYAASLAASAAAVAATGSDAAAAELARAHAGLPQPLVFSMGPEFRTARASGLSAENSMSLSAHTAAAAAARSKASFVKPGAGAR